jgi:misacylated tRNA(Ala) deacylase
MTEEIFRQDAYARGCEAKVVEVNEGGGIVLDRTVFYPTGGGQPGDRGALQTADGRRIAIATAVYGGAREIVHVPAEGAAPPAAGAAVTGEVDWPRRHKLMRMHTALHLLSAVLPYPVTGGQIEEDRGRLDFDIPEAGLDRDAITAEINRLIDEDHPVAIRWITEAELDARPELVKTMAVAPPRGTGQVRLVEIEGCDLQPCGGTHVRSTAEIGAVAVDRIEKKGAKNRRVRLVFA